MVIRQGLYLVAPHGRLVFDGDKKSIATGRKFPITGERVICSKEDGKGLAFGIATIGEPATIDSDRFDDYFSVHRVPKSARLKWWADKQFLYNYPIQRFDPFPEPIEIDVAAGTIMDMGEVELPFDPPPEGENHLVIPASAGKIMSSLEETMPWTASDASKFTAKADTPEKKKLWASTANGRLEQCKEDGGETKECEASAVRVANAAVAREKQFEEEREKELSVLVSALAPQLTKMVQAQVSEILGEKAGDDGEGDVGYCTCPNCKETFESDVSCSEAECPTCSGDAHAEDDKANGEQEEDAPEPVPMEKPEDAVPPKKPPVGGETEEKAGRRFSNSILEKLRSMRDTIAELVSHGEYADREPKEPDVVEAITSRITPVSLGKGFKSLGTDSQGRDWFMIWPTNAYRDREGEFFPTKALNDYVDRHAGEEVKCVADFWHVPGTEFGTIREQAVVADHFICQFGTYDDTPIGKAFKEFFDAYPDGHPTFAPEGWGASHQFHYNYKDRETGVFQVFDMEKSTVLPRNKAANIYNPEPIMGGFKMNEEQKAAINAIGTDLNIPGLVDQIVALGQNAKQKLDGAGVERKSIDDEQVPEVKAEKPPKDEDESQDDSEDEKPKEEKNVAEELANAVAERLGLHDLSNTISDILETQKAMQEQLASHDTTIGEVKQAKEEEVATALGAPRYVWQAFQASKAKETATTPDAQPTQGMPDTVKSIASKIGS